MAAADDLFSLLPWSDDRGPDRPGGLPADRWAAGRRPPPSPGRLRPGLDHHGAGPPAPAARRRWIEASTVTSPIRAVKDAAELDALRAAGAAADRVAAALQSGGIELVGRTEAEVSGAHRRPAGARRAIGGQLRHRGQRSQRRQSPSRAGRPGHRPGRDGGVRLRWHLLARRRCRLLLGHHPHRGDRAALGRGRRVLRGAALAQRTRSPRPGPGSPPSRSTRWPGPSSTRPVSAICSSTGPVTGSASRSTRTPTWWLATTEVLVPGHAFSVEPGIYWPGRFGMRLEDIVVIGADGGPSRSTRRPRPGRGRRLRRQPVDLGIEGRWRWWWPAPAVWAGHRRWPWPPRGCG